MKRLFLILLIFISLNVFGQLKVKEGSFRKLEGYVMLDKHEFTDQNNAPMALIRIYTENIKPEERTKFVFRGNPITGFDVRFHATEIELYVSAAPATYIEIMHPEYGKVEYNLPESLCDYCGYEMVVQRLVPTTQEPKQPQNNFLSIISDQENATIYIDDEYIGEKEVFKTFPIGSTHTWRIECDLYHTESGNVTISADDNVIERQLTPAYGFLNVTSSPENGALLFINNKKVGETPYNSDKLASGSYKVKVMKEMYKTTEMTFIVNDGQTTVANLEMPANFVNVTIKVDSDSDSDIYIDDEYKGKGRWSGRLSDGAHIVEARKVSHKTSRKEVNLVLGGSQIVTIEAPKPICGILEVSSSPMRADIYIDGELLGQTPKILSEILIGTHELRLEKQGCTSLTKTITIKESEVLTINEKLQTGKEISISTDKCGDKIYVDDNYIGTSPINATLAFGSHNIKAERDGKTVSKTINVSQSGGENNVKLGFKQEINGYEYVDLGLSVKWATCNIGANSPEDYGDYFAWGETTTKSSYTESNSKTYGKYMSDISGDSQYDAARAKWGATWRLPTRAEMEELEENCTWTWTTQGGKKGYKVTSKINGKSIFLPAAGYRSGSSLDYGGEDGGYWSSTPDESHSNLAYDLNFYSSYHYESWSYRYGGRSVRAVSE